MICTSSIKSSERGSTLLEFAIGATVFLSVMFAVLEFGRALWVHNALTDAARRGARYAVIHAATDADSVKNVVVYGDPNPANGTQPVVNNLTTANVVVTYSNFGLETGTVSVSITNYQFQFVVPLIGTTIQMPAYTTTLTGESVGLVPPNM
jgi:Flp pilus assembly protein TadG